MKRFIKSFLRNRPKYDKRCVTIPLSRTHATKLQSIQALASSNFRNQVPFAQGTSSSFTSAEQTAERTATKFSSFFYGAVTVALGTTVASDVTMPASRSLCDAPQDSRVGSLAIMTSPAAAADSVPAEEEKEIPLLATRPLWPGGVAKDDVDALVEIILEDPNINIQMIPDAIEAIVYKSAVKLVLNVFYRLLNKLNGLPLLSHQIQVSRLVKDNEIEIEKKGGRFSSFFGSEPKSRESQKKKKYRRIAEAADMKRSSVNDEVLNIIAARMLENQVVNNAYIPDAFEIYLYQSVLKVVFRALQILSHTFHINVCGHDLYVLIEPSTLEHSALTAASGKAGTKNRSMDSDIDMKMLQDFALKAGVRDDSFLQDEHLSWWDRFWLRRRRKMIANLHASLFGLILGVVDDILQHSSVKILSDDIFLDIAQPSGDRTNKAALARKKKDSGKTKVDPEAKKASSAKSSSTYTFAAGIGVGAGLMFLVSGSR